MSRASRSYERWFQAGSEGISTTDLQARLDIPWTTMNHHLDRLVSAGLVTVRREGKFAYHTADYPALRAVTDFLWEDCCKHGKVAAKGKASSGCCG
jgi:DNA-binding transcriptional ArsR family regulator